MTIAKKELDEWIKKRVSSYYHVNPVSSPLPSARFESHSRFQGSTALASTEEKEWKVKELQEAGRSPILAVTRPLRLQHSILTSFFEKEEMYYIHGNPTRQSD